MRIAIRSYDWVVIAEWYGASRIVFRGTVWECIEYRRANS